MSQGGESGDTRWLQPQYYLNLYNIQIYVYIPSIPYIPKFWLDTVYTMSYFEKMFFSCTCHYLIAVKKCAPFAGLQHS